MNPPEKAAKDRLHDLWEGITDYIYVEGKHHLRAARKLNPYLRMRIAVVASWALLTLLTLLIAPPGRAQNELGASVRTGVTDLYGGTFLIVENQEEDPWTNVELHLNGRYLLRLDRVDPGVARTVPSSEFQNPSFRPEMAPLVWPMETEPRKISAPFNTPPRNLLILCDEGQFEVTFGGEE